MKKSYFFLICLVAGLWSCSSGPKPQTDAETATETAAAADTKAMYKRQELGQFLRDTDPNRVSNEYMVGIGDRLDVVFFYHADLTTLDLLVRPDGRITLPYVGDVMAAGHSPMYLDSTLTTRFEEILREPNLSIIVRSTQELRVYVLGEVEQPGHVAFPVDMSLVQAISQAGGHKSSAKMGNVIVIRREGADRILGVVVDVGAIINGGQIQNDFQLSHNDIIYVPRTRIAKAADFMQELDDVVRPPLDWVLRGLQISLLRDNFFFISN